MPAIERQIASLDDILARTRRAAAQRDQHGEGLDEEIGWLGKSGFLADAMPAILSGVPTWSEDPLAIVALLRRIGAASLPLGRLVEGHINATQLIGLYGTPSLQRRCAEALRGGALLGVWGADGVEPLSAQAIPSGFILDGSKAFCSGLGLVEIALVSAWTGDHTQLFCVDVSDASRGDDGQWQVTGMRASKSGGYDFSGMRLPVDAAIGGPDAYFAEPHFLGGMYRMCAVQVGGLDELLAELVVALRARGKSGDPLAQFRVGQIASLRLLAGNVTEGAARQLGGGFSAEDIAQDAVLMREGVEHCIVQSLEILDRSLGTQSHREASAVSRLRRDLAMYVRQAAVDERLMMVGRRYLAGSPGVAPDRGAVRKAVGGQ